MDIVASRPAPDLSTSPTLSNPANLERGDGSLQVTDHPAQQVEWSISSDSGQSHDSTSASTPRAGQGTRRGSRDSSDCERMIEKWRLIRLADKNRLKKKIYHTHNAFTSSFGRNYSKVYEAFEQGLTSPQPRPPLVSTVPAKRRSEPVSAQPSKRLRGDDRASLPQPDRYQDPPISAQPSPAATTNDSVREGPGELPSTSAGVEESSFRPRPRAESATKEPPARRKGVGLYAGNWEYVTDEEKVPEYLTVAEKIADVEGRTTRRAFAKLTSNESPRESGSLIRSALENQVRKSGRARNTVDYAALSSSEDITGDLPVPQQSQQTEMTPSRAAKQMSPSSASSPSNRSTLMTNAQRRSTSNSFATSSEQLERPKLSWNAIVYEVLALADAPLTFTQLTQDIKNRFPFFQAASQEKVLKSGLKNPLYFHEAFCKGGIINGKQTWGLKPGVWTDKKTGETLTPPPRAPILPNSHTEQVHEKEIPSPTPVDLTPTASQPPRPRSSNPRFGRPILNSPEIPDSQYARSPTPRPLEADSHIDAEQASHFRESAGAHEHTSAEKSTAAVTALEASNSVPSPQARSDSSATAGTFLNNNNVNERRMSADAEDRDVRNSIELDRHEVARKEGQSVSVLEAAEPYASSSPSSSSSSTRDGENFHNSPTSQFVSAPTGRQPVESTSPPPTLPGDDAPASQRAHFIPATPEPPACLIPCSQLDDVGSDGKARAKEGSYMRVQRWA